MPGRSAQLLLCQGAQPAGQPGAWPHLVRVVEQGGVQQEGVEQGQDGGDGVGGAPLVQAGVTCRGSGELGGGSVAWAYRHAGAGEWAALCLAVVKHAIKIKQRM